MAAYRKLGKICVFATVGLICIGILTRPPAAAEVHPSPFFEWNVFLGNWHVIGPFPRTDRNNSCLGVDFLSGEPKVDLLKPVTWKDKQYEWTVWSEAVADIRRALSVGDETEYHVAYAYTSFKSPKKQKAILALGHDDGTRVWLNGEQVHRHDLGTSAYLDQAAIEVDLKKGVNTLLMKVTQRWGAWAALARLRPAGLNKPLMTFGCNYRPGSGTLNLPRLQLDLLGRDGRTLQTLHASGYRVKDPARILFTFYATVPDPEPEKVRIRYQHTGLADYDETITWAEAREGTFDITATSTRPLSGLIVDGETNKPISGAQFKIAQRTYRKRSDEQGRFTLAEYSPLETTLWAAAAGYEPEEVLVDVPEEGEFTISLKPGAQVLRGTVLDEDGRPIQGARIKPGLYRGWTPQATTNKEGLFEIVGIPADKDSLYPTVVHPDYVAKDGFGQPMDADRITEVQWVLKTGVIVTGRVTAKADGRLLEGIPVLSGFSRFASNRVNPEAKTDADGRYRLTGVNPGEALIHAFSDQFAPNTKRIDAQVGEPVEVDFQLEPGKPVTGRVTDPKGKPIKKVWIITDTWEGVRMFRRETWTDADGRFTLAHMPSTPVETNILGSGYVNVRDLMTVGGEHYDLTLKPVVKHSVSLRLSDTKRPPEKIEVHVGYLFAGRDQISWDRRSYFDRNYKAETGIYEIEEDETSTAKRFLRFRVPGYKDAELEIPVDATESRSFDFVLEKLGVIHGKVVSADDGQPLAGITVALVNKQDRIRMDHYVQFEAGFRKLDEFTGAQVVTDPHGSFDVPQIDADSEYDILLIKKDAGFHYIPNAHAVFEQQPIELPYPKHGVVEGTVSVAGKPSPRESVHIGWIPNTGTGSDWDHPFGCGGIVHADLEGRFRFAGLGPGRYRLSRVREFRTPGMGGISCYLAGDELVLTPGETLTHNLVQPAGITVTGQTIDPEGKPLGGCIVSVSRTWPKRERLDVVRCDSEGRFTVVHLPKGSFEFSADHYTRKTGSTCGLGDEDYRGRTTVEVAEGTEVTIPMKPATGGQQTAATLTGTIPPDFTAKIFGSDETFTLSEHWGKVVAIDFWATWCGPCMAVMPEMKKIHEEYADREDVVFITVSLDNSEARLREVIKDKELDFPIIFSGEGWGDDAAQVFGVRAIPSSFVIGRDGRFAAERTHGAQLAAAIKSALDKPLNPAFADGAKPARLTVKVGVDEEGTSMPGVKLHLTSMDADGKTVFEEDLPMPGQASQIVWLYPELPPGGKVTATARAEGMEEQTQSLNDPDQSALISFLFQSPRKLTGRIAADNGENPAPGMKITASRDDGFQRSAISDEKGHFRIPVLPGVYTVRVEGNEAFVPIPGNRASTEVGKSTDPQPLALDACRTVVVKGVVKDEAGEAVAGADVYTSYQGDRVKTDQQGHFTLPGVPSVGKVNIFAGNDNKSGKLELEDADSGQELEIQLGQSSGLRDALVAGNNVPALTAYSLRDSTSLDWEPARDRNTLVVFCALWHPQGVELLKKANAWAAERDIHLAAFSIDWHPQQARRHMTTLDAEVLYAGPGGLTASADWRFVAPGQAFLVAPTGRLISSPKPMELP
jgi:thiol-disulfide isomerase/thioredoxin/protocatechuate 3,4-dioxygenase beta subunit